MRLTIACPANHLESANHLAMALGYSEADRETYRNPGYQDALGNLYACASLPVGPNFVPVATSPLQRPEWDTAEVIDMTKANQAQALVRLWQPSDEAPTPPLATPDTILAAVGEDGPAMLAAMGLTAIQQEGSSTNV